MIFGKQDKSRKQQTLVAGRDKFSWLAALVNDAFLGEHQVLPVNLNR